MSQEESRSDLARIQDLEVRLYKLTTRSHLRVGAGEGSADMVVENPLIRALIYHNGHEERVPYIPGSSLHGVIRAWVEKALRSSQDPLSAKQLNEHLAELKETNEAAHDNLLNRMRQEIADFLGKEKQAIEDAELFKHWKVYTSPDVCDPLSEVDKCERMVLQEDESHWKVEWWKQIKRQVPCAACHIFGYMGQRGRIKFTPAWPAATIDDMPIDIITRVAINRLTGAADEGKLFNLEAVSPGVDFYFFTVLENMAGHTEEFEKGFRALDLQVAGIGAHSTIGFGMVDVKSIFTATIDPDVFGHDIGVEFVDKMLKKANSKMEIPVDLEKIPRFFRALVIAHELKQPYEKLIVFDKGNDDG
jgi:CRISPR type III-B/RAMP module RAMP protein Cmr6